MITMEGDMRRGYTGVGDWLSHDAGPVLCSILSCSSVMVNGVTYYQCGSAWYQPAYPG